MDEPESVNSNVTDLSQFSIPNFRMPTIASIIGDMGQPLEHGPTAGETATWDGQITPHELATPDRDEGYIQKHNVVHSDAETVSLRDDSPC